MSLNYVNVSTVVLCQEGETIPIFENEFHEGFDKCLSP